MPRIARLAEPVDPASLKAFRFMLGVLLAGALARSWQKGVIEHGLLEPRYFFPYFSLALPSPGVYAYPLYVALGLLALGFALGRWPRWCAGLFSLGFTYLHCVDITHYLNHYYLVTLLTALLALTPIGERSAPRWVLCLFRFQIGLVYFFGGVAKLKSDWLFLGEPLHTWLAANTDVPLLGPLFAYHDTAFVMSWLGAAYDLSIPFALSWRRTRPFAYLAVLAFHLLTARLFQIGLFPWLMMVASLLFLSPSWPRRLLTLAPFAAEQRAFPRRTQLLLAVYASWQLLVPLRHWLYPGNVLWSEQGYRWSWNVMLIEKTGSAEFTVVDRATGRKRVVFPRSILTQAQNKMMATQPDMILAFAHELARRAGGNVAVYADVFAVLNGRPAARLIDPHTDLTRERDTLANKPWILPAPR